MTTEEQDRVRAVWRAYQEVEDSTLQSFFCWCGSHVLCQDGEGIRRYSGFTPCGCGCHTD